MITIEDGVNVTMKQTKDGIVLVIGNTPLGDTGLAAPVVVSGRGKYNRKRAKKSGTVDANGNHKWMRYTTKSGKSATKLNPKFNPDAVVQTSGVALLGQDHENRI